MSDIITLAMECLEWDRKKVMSWYVLENPRLRKSRPSELVDRNQGQLVVNFLEEKKQERIENERKQNANKKRN